LRYGTISRIARTEERRQQKEVVFVIDVNIDGVQLFKNFNCAQAYPILGRVYSVGSKKIPIKKSPPFLIGMYHGPGGSGGTKMPLDAFLYDFLDELKRLDPGSPKGNQKCAVALRLMICDAPMRATLKGTVGHTGYWACERCRVRYVHIRFAFNCS
jgi:hypothetical protein